MCHNRLLQRKDMRKIFYGCAARAFADAAKYSAASVVPQGSRSADDCNEWSCGSNLEMVLSDLMLCFGVKKNMSPVADVCADCG